MHGFEPFSFLNVYGKLLAKAKAAAKVDLHCCDSYANMIKLFASFASVFV